MAFKLNGLGEDNVLEVIDLSVRFGRSPVFKGLTFRVARGTSLAIVGPNGAGKTMLFRALLGAVQVGGKFRWAPGVRIGYVPQKLDIARDVPITGLDVLRARASLARSKDDSIAHSLSAVDLSSETANAAIGELSGGEFQRLLVAFALMGAPDVLLMDEPAAGIDESGRQHLTELVHRLQRDQGLTVLQISHDLAEVCRCATTVLCLSREHIQIGSPREILTPALLHKIYGTPVAFNVHGVLSRSFFRQRWRLPPASSAALQWCVEWRLLETPLACRPSWRWISVCAERPSGVRSRRNAFLRSLVGMED